MEDVGAVWGSSSTKGVSHPYWELWGLEGQCSLERDILATNMTNVRTGQEKTTSEDTRQLSTHSKGLLVGEKIINRINKQNKFH